MRSASRIEVYHIVLEKSLIEVGRKPQYVAERWHTAHFDVRDTLGLFFCSKSQITHVQDGTHSLPINLLVGGQNEEIVVVFASHDHSFGPGFQFRTANPCCLLA